jgi:hypothetical protein
VRTKKHIIMVIKGEEEVEGEYKIGIALSTANYKI